MDVIAIDHVITTGGQCTAQGGYSTDGQMFTLNTIERHSVCYSVDCRNLYMNLEISGTLQAKNEGGTSLNFVNPILKMNDE